MLEPTTLGGPLALSDGGAFGSPHASLVPPIVHHFPDPDLIPVLEHVETVSPARARPQLLRSMLEIVARTSNEAAGWVAAERDG